MTVPNWAPPLSDGPASTVRSPLVSHRLRAAGLWVLAACAVIAVSAFFNALSWHTFPGNSDDANAVLAGHAISHGNFWLHGWRLPADTYWPMDLGVYAVFTALAGIGPAAYHAVPTAIYTAVVVASMVLVAADASGRSRWIGLGVTFLIIGLPAPVVPYFALQGPHHVGSVLLCLCAFGLLASAGSVWRWCLGTSVLAAAVLGDPVVLAIGVAPVALAGFVAAVRARRWRAGVWRWTAAALAVVGAASGRRVLAHFGQQTVAGPPIIASHFVRNAAAMPRELMTLFGVGHTSRLSGLSQTAHVVGFAFAIAAVLVASWSVVVALTRQPRHVALLETRSLDDVLTLAFFGSLGLYIITTSDTNDASNLRYLLPSAVFAAILAGRLAARVPVRAPKRGAVLAGACLAGLVAIYTVDATVRLRDPVPARAQALVAWLDAHSLTNGIAPYWDASTVTVESGSRLAIKPVILAGTRIRPFYYYASAESFAPSQPPPRSSFLVYKPGAPWGGVDAQSATATFGPPAATTQVGGWQVLVWDRDVVPELGLPG